MEIQTIDEYINQYPKEIKYKLLELRKIIHKYAPKAIEKISWRMPTFYQNGNLIHFAVFKNHIGLYPGPDVIEELKEELKDYKTSKGAIQIPHNKGIPKGLIKKIIKYNLENRN